jgi:hypothetical protein
VTRLLLAAAAAMAGVAVGWAAAGRIAAVACLAVGVAAVNGLAKAHSP